MKYSWQNQEVNEIWWNVKQFWKFLEKFAKIKNAKYTL